MRCKDERQKNISEETIDTLTPEESKLIIASSLFERQRLNRK